MSDLYTVQRLLNGIRLVLVPMQKSPAVTVLALASTGSKFELKEESGIAHFLEHMCFKGTSTRPKAIDISRELDALGAQYNAFTSREYTGYYAKVAHRHFQTALSVVSDIYTNPTFPPSEIEKEKGVIVEEINMYRDVPQYHVHDVYNTLLYGDQPAGWNIAGTKETVLSFTRDHLTSFHQKGYTGNSTVVVVAGNFDEKNVVEYVSQAFANVKAGDTPKKLPVVFETNRPMYLFEEKKSDQAHVVMGVKIFDVYDSRNPALSVLSAVLGGGMSSRLFEKLRNELGICYYVSVDADEYTDHGSLDISFGADASRTALAIETVVRELSDIREQGVPEDELCKAKEYITGSLALSLETSNSFANFFGAQEIVGRPIKSPEQVAKEIGEVTTADVLSVAKTIFKDNGIYLALVGPAPKDPIDRLINIS